MYELNKIYVKDGFTFRFKPGVIEVWSERIKGWYQIDVNKRTCNCIGFKFRKYCKHFTYFKSVIDEIAKPTKKDLDSFELIKKITPKGERTVFNIVKIIGETEYDKLIEKYLVLEKNNRVYVI
jgi:hypothetical protein